MAYVNLFLLLAVVCMLRAASAYTDPYCETYRHTRKVWVKNDYQFSKAVRTSKPGDLILIGNGTFHHWYNGKETLFRGKKANKWRPITLCGDKNTVIDAKGKIGFRIKKSNYINLVGITVKNAHKGIRLETAKHCVLDRVTVTKIASEGIHIQYGSHYNTVKNSTITKTGRKVKGVGEGIYLGSSRRNVRRDTCIGNKILDNKIGPGVTAEPIDVKENSRNGVIRGNVLDGRDLCGCRDAVSLINVKGNGYLIENNVGRNAREHFYKASKTIPGEGRNNTFKNNVCLGSVRRGFTCTKKPGGGNRGNKYYRAMHEQIQ